MHLLTCKISNKTWNTCVNIECLYYHFCHQYSGLTSILLPDLQCLICKEVFRDPVCIPCGHSYCKTCVKSHWMEPIQEGVFVCPQCSRPYSTCPELNINEVADRMRNKILGSIYHQAKPENVTCKFCTVTYCEKHKQHYTVPALQKHRPKGSIDSEKEVHWGKNLLICVILLVIIIQKYNVVRKIYMYVNCVLNPQTYSILVPTVHTIS